MDNLCTVFINGKEIPLYRAICTFSNDRIDWDGHVYDFAICDTEFPASLEIRSARDLKNTTVLPTGAITSLETGEHIIRATIEKPGAYIFEPDGYKNTPLILFFNSEDCNVPDKNDPLVKWFGPGVHKAGRIELQSNETLYLAPGAIVETSVFAHGDNIRICGHGILTQRSMARRDVWHCLDFYKCTNLHLEGFTAADPCHWNLVLRDCEHVLIDNVKLCGGRMINDDGIDICNSRDVIIQNCFIRAQDDIITPKGLYDLPDQTKRNKDDIAAFYQTEGRAIRNVLVQDCVFWCDAANVFRIGYECIAETMADITVRNCDIVHFCDVYRPAPDYWCNTIWYIQPSHRMTIQNLLFENLRIHCDGQNLILMKIVSMECPPFVDFGNVRNCTFRNISVNGIQGNFHGEIFLEGHDENRKIEDIRFENFQVFGQTITAQYPNLTVGNFADMPIFS